MSLNKEKVRKLATNLSQGLIGYRPTEEEMKKAEKKEIRLKWFVYDPFECQKDDGTVPCIDYQYHFWEIFDLLDGLICPKQETESIGDYLKRILEHLDTLNQEAIDQLLLCFKCYIDRIDFIQQHKEAWIDHEEEISKRLIDNTSIKRNRESESCVSKMGIGSEKKIKLSV